MLKIDNLHVTTGEKELLKGVSLSLAPGEVVALMGPNGSGKTSLTYSLMGHPEYSITNGTITLNSEDITSLSPDARAKRGLFLAFQNPLEIPGLTFSSFLRSAVNTQRAFEGKEKLNVFAFSKLLTEKMEQLGIAPSFAERNVNENFSGGEKKKAEMLQLLLFQPKYAILDETDSGLDIDSLTMLGTVLKMIRTSTGILLITHYQKLLDSVKPDRIHILNAGTIIKSGDSTLAHEVAKTGFQTMVKEYG